MIPASGNERVPLESGGKVTGFCKKKIPEYDGNGSSIPAGIFLDFFGDFPVVSRGNSHTNGHNSTENG
jgi:hypothetical protein